MGSETAGSGELQPRQPQIRPKTIIFLFRFIFLARSIPQSCSFHQDKKEDT